MFKSFTDVTHFLNLIIFSKGVLRTINLYNPEKPSQIFRNTLVNKKAFLRKQESRNNHFLDGFLTNPVGFSGMPMDDKGKYDCEAYNL